ncbi:damage-inducible protein DinB [Pedobacter sp. G11]|uniref:DinB family protein n=1 Tax=Pedobacter sp. G11 TaxID=2482728 RepID=UPI000F5E5087|nr:DinB family protein [Pedobacter sp. G11]AZI26387.1 damage-inducible protein DinB [Pedobacter sp. G11]
MNKKYFREMTDYLRWADSKAIGWITEINDQQWNQQISSSFNSIRKTALHIVSAEKIWLDFWTGVPSPVYLSAGFEGSKEDLIDIWRMTSANLQEFIEKYPEKNYQDLVSISKPNGEIAQMSFWRTFPHMVNHSSYHRGQMVTLLRQTGFTLLSNTDLFTFYHLHHTEGKAEPV